MLVKVPQFVIVLAAALAVLPGTLSAQNREKAPSMQELAEKEADRLARLLDLEDWQLFYVDSTLQHDYAALDASLKELQDAKVGNTDLYVAVHDKWMEQTYLSLQRFMTPEQWQKYLKSGAGKEAKAREKRKAAAQKKSK